MSEQLKPFWLSWVAITHDYCIHFPHWVSGEDANGNSILVCAVWATNGNKAKGIINNCHFSPNTHLSFRFCEEKSIDWSPFCDRFQRANWMIWWTDGCPTVTSERDALKAKLDARNKVTENIISDDLSDKIIANWREYYSKLPLERQTGGDLFIQKCLNAIESLRWSFDECMRQYDIQQERACNAEAKLAEANEDAERLARKLQDYADHDDSAQLENGGTFSEPYKYIDEVITLHRARVAKDES